MSARNKQSKQSQSKGSKEGAPNLAATPKKAARSVGIDNRNESTRRYGALEPEGYSRHLHGNREGEFQRGGKPQPKLPVEEGSPIKQARLRNGPEEREESKGQFGGKTFDKAPGDRDIVGKEPKKPRARRR